MIFIGCTSEESSNSNSSCVNNTNPVFSHTPFNPSDILSIVPLGVVSTGGETKNRLQIQIPLTTPRTEVPVYAPVDFKVKSVRAIDFGSPEISYWGLRGEVSCEITIGFDHITNPEPKLRNSTTLKDGNLFPSFVDPETSISYIAGELIGFTIGTATYATSFDYFVLNSLIENPFVNLERYRNDISLTDFLRGDCPIRFQSASTKSLLESKFGYDGPVIGATCRNVSRDVAGSLAGMWFSTGIVSGSPGSIGDRLAIQTEMQAPSTIKSQIRISTFSGSNDLGFSISGNDPELDIIFSNPAQRSVCYDNGSVAFYFTLMSETTIRSSRSTSPCDPVQLPLTANYLELER